MKLSLIKPKESMLYDITDAVTSISWSGNILSAGRTLEFSYINNPYDKNLNIPVISEGDYAAFEVNGDEVYFGQIYDIVRSSAIGTLTFSSADMMRNLLESSGRYNFKNLTPEDIAAMVLNDVQVPYNNLAVTNYPIKSMIVDSKSIYDIIMSAYTVAYKATGKRYLPMIWHRAFGVWEAVYSVGNFELSDKNNIISININESCGQLTNLIKIYDDKGMQIGEVRDDESISKFGIFQQNYSVEDKVDPMTAAKNMLKVLPEQNITISAIGDINCLSGYSVIVNDSATGLSGKYWIKSDKHTFSNNNHMMELELSFEQLMDTKEG